MVHHNIFRPHTVLGKAIMKKNQGTGMGSVLLDGGLGGQSSYSSVDDYLATTNHPAQMKKRGMGLAEVGDKLEDLVVKPIHKKIRNIKFNM
jgi:hypothetical protein